MGKLNKVLPKSWCILPWVHCASLANGDLPLCCVASKNSGMNLKSDTIFDYFNSSYIHTIREKMLKGEYIAECEHCQLAEKHGNKSHRISENNQWEKLLGIEFITELINRTNRNLISPISLDLRLSNQCNLECIMCSPRESSRWNHLSSTPFNRSASIFYKIRNCLYPSTNGVKKAHSDNLLDQISTLLPNLREIILGGGEPFLMPEVVSLLKMCVEKNEAKHIKIRFHTNGTIYSSNLISLFTSFEEVEIFVSIDGTERVNKYIRYPSSFARISENLQAFDLLPDNVYVRILFSVQALNISNIPDFLDEILKLNLKKISQPRGKTPVHFGIVHYPKQLSICVLPADIKGKVTHQLEQYFSYSKWPDNMNYRAICDYMNSQDHSELMPSLKKYLLQLDARRKTNYRDVFDFLKGADD